MQHFQSLIDLFRAFPNEAACIKHLRAIRWRNGEYCPHCGHDKIYQLRKGRRLFKCAQCNINFSIRVGTIFEDSKLPLQKWFAAIWLITNHPKGIASTTLAKDLHVTQKTAWFILHRLRYASRLKGFDKPLSGIVEIDQTFVKGGKPNKARKDGHVGVIGAAERGGRVIARVIHTGLGHGEAQRFIDDVVSPKAQGLVTDGASVFFGVTGHPNHEMINHKKEGHTRGTVHTQTIEGVWAQLKRQIYGIHHWVSPKHLQNYVNEMAWRMSRRDLTVTDRMNSLFGHVEGKLPYKVLIA